VPSDAADRSGPATSPTPGPPGEAAGETAEETAGWARGVETHRAIRGRRWRVSDPRIPEPLRQVLVDELMAARRAVRDAGDATAERAARDRVHDAKVALGERGLRWWVVDADPAQVAERIRRAARALERTDHGGSLVDAVAAVTSLPAANVADHLAPDQLGDERDATGPRQPLGSASSSSTAAW
jgi:hypothetical protein